jgi:hypothetical protein
MKRSSRPQGRMRLQSEILQVNRYYPLPLQLARSKCTSQTPAMKPKSCNRRTESRGSKALSEVVEGAPKVETFQVAKFDLPQDRC